MNTQLGSEATTVYRVGNAVGMLLCAALVVLGFWAGWVVLAPNHEGAPVTWWGRVYVWVGGSVAIVFGSMLAVYGFNTMKRVKAWFTGSENAGAEEEQGRKHRLEALTQRYDTLSLASIAYAFWALAGVVNYALVDGAEQAARGAVGNGDASNLGIQLVFGASIALALAPNAFLYANQESNRIVERVLRALPNSPTVKQA